MTGSITSGQLLSRAGGHYKIQGIVGLAIMSGGVALLSTLTVNTHFAVAVAYIVMTGLGLGITFPLYTVIVQNAVPYRYMGVLISSVPFSRFMGGTFGLAILGSLLGSRFSSQFIGKLPSEVTSLVPPSTLQTLASNPQALVSTEAQQQLSNILSQFGPQAQQIYDQIIEALRTTLMSALRETFLIALGATVLAFLIHIFIKEIPLKKQHDTGGGSG